MTQIIPMAETPDIYQALLDGNPDGVWPIWFVWRGPLIVWGFRFLKDRDLVEDAVVDTFIAMRGHAGTFNDAAHIRAWMHSTVRNKCWSALRRQRQLVSLEDEAEYSADPAAYQSIDIKDADIMSRNIIQLILKRLDKMPRKRRRDCYAFLFQGKTIAQIAKERNVSRPTVDKNVQLGLAVIQKYLIDMGLNF
jgi:RNA polymerase sigma factor (sigma-70 family)